VFVLKCVNFTGEWLIIRCNDRGANKRAPPSSGPQSINYEPRISILIVLEHHLARAWQQVLQLSLLPVYKIILNPHLNFSLRSFRELAWAERRPIGLRSLGNDLENIFSRSLTEAKSFSPYKAVKSCPPLINTISLLFLFCYAYKCVKKGKGFS